MEKRGGCSQLSPAFSQVRLAGLFLGDEVLNGTLGLIDGYLVSRLKTLSKIGVATGEKLFSFREFKEVIDHRACAFLQPDVSHSFGLDNYLHIARLAEEAQMLMAPHNASGPIHFAALMHADSAIGNFLIQETPGTWCDGFREYVDHDFTLEEGYVLVPNRPGLGIEVREEQIAQLPYTERMSYRQYRHADGSWKGW